MFRLAFACLALGFPIWADITLRYGADVKISAALPPEAAEMMKQQFKDEPSGLFRGGLVLYYAKDGRSAVQIGDLITFSDPATGQTLELYPSEKIYVRSTADLEKKDAKTTDESLQELIGKGKLKVETEKSQRTKKIKDIAAEERVAKVEINLSGMLPAAMAAKGAGEGADKIGLRFSLWAPLATEVERVPALRHLKELTQMNASAANPAQMIAREFGKNPQLAAQALNVWDELSPGGMFLELRLGVQVPGFGMLMLNVPGAAMERPSIDPGEPFMEFVLELKELSTAKITGTVFEIPDEFKEVTQEELMKRMAAKQAPKAVGFDLRSRPPDDRK